VLMGLGRRDAARRLDAVLDFAGLREFADLKLKNYSSGMMVRLAFAAMVEADADIMLVDEVLAVGDAAFAQKCMEVFREKRRIGKTLVLVTHDMAAVQSFCDRAMLIHNGRIRYLGDPEETAQRYFRLNFGGAATLDGVPRDDAARVVDVWIEDAAGRPIEDAREREPFRFNATLEAVEDLQSPGFGFQVLNRDGVPVFGFGKMFTDDPDEGGPDRVAAGQRVRISAGFENTLVPDRYHVSCTVSRDRTQGDVALKVPHLLEFNVLPRNAARVAIEEYEVGMVSVRNDIEATLERA
jgi:energy-coupling factor transporter ATP-binding protein EcfA2